MTEIRWARPLALVGLCCTIAFGEPAFYILLGIVLSFFLTKPQSYLGLLFFSGLIKNAPLIPQLPIDVTLLSYILFILYVTIQRIKNKTINKNSIPIAIILACSFIIVFLSLLTTIAPWSYISIYGIFIVLLYLPLLLMIIQLPVEEVKKNVSQLLNLSLYLGYLWVGMGLHNSLIGYAPPQQEDPSAQVEHLSAFGEDYMTFSSFVVLIFIDALVQFFFRRSYILHGLLLIVLTYTIMNSPARGLTLGLILAAITLLGIYVRKATREKILVLCALPIGLLLFMTLYLSHLKDNVSIDRLTNFDPSGVSINHRLTSIKVGYEHWKDQMFFGTGTSSIAFYNGAPGYHAHNPIIEIIFEYGLVGGIPLLLFFGLSLFLYYRLLTTRIMLEKSPVELWLAGAFTTFFIFGMFSGTLGDMRQLWILLAIIITLGISHTQVRTKTNN